MQNDKPLSNHINTYFSSRTEALAGILFSQLPNADSRRKNPFQRTYIVVPNSGMKRYLELKIAEEFGIFSHIDISFASRFLGNCYRQLLPSEQRNKYLSTRQLTFAILSLWNDDQSNADSLPQQLPKQLQNLLSNHQTQRQRYELAGQVAKLFNQYLNERPELIEAWQQDNSIYQHPHEDWQRELFTQLQLGQFAGDDLQRQFHHTLLNADTDKTINLPSVHLFGFHAIPPVQLADFMALSEKTDVNAYIFNPSVAYWQDIVPESVKAAKLLTNENEAKLMTTGNPLLSTWGQAGKYLLEELNNDATPLNVDESYQLLMTSMLSWLQNEVREGNETADTDSLQKIIETEKEPYSLSLHIAASPRREVEILYDNLCKQFEQGNLNPSDVLVMMPNLRDYAPHIESVFGAQPQQSIPFSLANQTAAEADPDTQTFLALLRVIDGDFSAQALFDVISEENIRQQFNLSANDVQTIHYWLIESRTAKSFYDDSNGRADSLEKLQDALLLAMIGGKDCRVDTDKFTRSALYHYENGQKDSLIGLTKLLHIFTPFVQLKSQQKSITAWRDTLLLLANNFLGDNNTVVTRLQQWHDEIITDEQLVSLPTDKLFDYDSVITDVIALLESDELHGPFLSGGISFCAMVPMRSIPAKMICLLGLNQEFPTIIAKNPLDLRQAEPRWSDKNINKEYRYFFLETLMACREQLYLSYVGKDEQTGSAIPPSILIEDLLSFIEKYHDGYTKKITNDYPLQGFLYDKQKDNETYQPLFIVPDHTEYKAIHTDSPLVPTQFSGKQLASYLAEPMQLYLSQYLSLTPIAIPEKGLAEYHTVALESGLDKWAFNDIALNNYVLGTGNTDKLIQENRYPPDVISQTLLANADDKIQPLGDGISEFMQADNQTRSEFIHCNYNEKTFSLLWKCPHYNNEQGQWDYRISALNGDKLMRHWVSHVLMNNVTNLPNYESHLFTLDKDKVTQTSLSKLDNPQKALTDLLALFEYIFSTPCAVSLNLTKGSFCYKDADYPLYPRLMQSARNSDNEVLQDYLSVVDEMMKNCMQ